MLDSQAVLTGFEHRLNRELLGSIDDVLDHRTGVEVLEIHHLFVAIGVGDLKEAIVVDLGIHPINDLLDHRLDAQRPVTAELCQVVGMHRQIHRQVLTEDVLGGFGVRALDLDLHVETSRPQDRRVNHVLAVRCTDDDDVLQALDAVDLAEQLRHDRGLDVGADACPAGAEDRVHLIEEDDDRSALGGLFPGPLEDQPDVALGLAHELIEQLRALDIQEVGLGFPGVFAADLGHLLGQRVGDRFGDQRLAAAGWTVEQHTLRRAQRVLPVQILVQER